jgi:hypothetical protein
MGVASFYTCFYTTHMKTVKQKIKLDQSTKTLSYTFKLELEHEFQERLSNDAYRLLLILLGTHKAMSILELAEKLGVEPKDARRAMKSLESMLTKKLLNRHIEHWPMHIMGRGKKYALIGQRPTL